LPDLPYQPCAFMHFPFLNMSYRRKGALLKISFQIKIGGKCKKKGKNKMAIIY